MLTMSIMLTICKSSDNVNDVDTISLVLTCIHHHENDVNTMFLQHIIHSDVIDVNNILKLGEDFFF